MNLKFLIKKQEVTLKNATSLQIGDTTAINLELFLAPDYYKATMERYEEIVKSNLHPLENFF